MIPESFPATGTDLGAALTRLVTHHRIGLHLVFEGRLDAERLRRAVRLTLDAEPILGCRFAPEARRREWQRLGDLDARTPFAVIETRDAAGECVAFQAAEVPDEGPQVAVALFRGEGRDELGLKVSHVVADGQAMKQYACLLARTYTRLGEDPAWVPEPDRAPRGTEADVWKALSAEQRRAARKAASYALPNWPHSGGSTGRGLTYRGTAIAPERLRALKAYGSEREASVNQLVLATYFRVLTARLDPPAGRVLTLMNTADHRRYLPHPEALPISNLSISGSVGVERVDGEGFDATLARIRRTTDAWAATCYGAAPAATAERIARLLGYRWMRRLMTPMLTGGGGGRTMPFLTNVGVVDEHGLAFGTAFPAEAVMYGPSAAGAGYVAMVSTYRERLSVTMGFCEEDLDAAAIEGILEAFRDELPV